MMVFPLPLSSLGLLSILTYRYCFLEHFPKHSGPPPSAGVASRRFPAQPPPLCRCCLFLLPALLFIPALIGVRLMTTERRKRLDGARSPEGTPVLGGDRLRQRLIRDDPTHRLLFFLLACLAYSLVLLATFTFCNDHLVHDPAAFLFSMSRDRHSHFFHEHSFSLSCSLSPLWYWTSETFPSPSPLHLRCAQSQFTPRVEWVYLWSREGHLGTSCWLGSRLDV